MLKMSLESIPVSSYMTRNVKMETENQNIHVICKVMNENNIGSIIIVALGNSIEPVGIITERDIVRIIGKLNPAFLHVPIRDLMSKPLITLSPESTIRDALQTMQQKNIRRIPIVDREAMVGIITDKDVFHAILKNEISLDNLVDNAATSEGHKLVFEQCKDYFFDDMLQKM